MLTNRDQPDLVLRWMNEAGVFGRFVPDFGRIVAQMQFDMYHHYTVDEHSIRAIGLLAAIERGELADDHPVDRLVPPAGLAPLALCRGAAPRHRQGRGGDHSELGAEIALDLCPRFGLDPAETEMVAWLVRHHLLLSNTPPSAATLPIPRRSTISFAPCKAPSGLRLLLILTVVDIRAVGPTTWTEWKRQMLRALFDAAEERLRRATSSAAEATRSPPATRR